MTRLSAVAAAAALALAGTAAPVQADGFFEGKTIRLIHAGSAGGSYAIYTRIFADHVARHIPGNPAVVADFMTGSGGLKAQNYVYNAASKDGLVLGMPLPSVVTAPLLYPKSAKFTPSGFTWLGNITQMQTAIGVMKATSPATTIEEAKAKQVILGSTGKGSELTLTPTVLNDVIGTKFRIIGGYKGIGPIDLAMENGELHGRSGGLTAWHQLKPEWFGAEPKIVFMVQLGLGKHPSLPDVPLATELAQNDEQRAVLDLLSRSTTLTRAVFAPPGIPADRAAALRAAFDATLKDPAWIAEMEKRKMQIVGPMNWQEIDLFLAETEATPPAIVARFQKALGVEP